MADPKSSHPKPSATAGGAYNAGAPDLTRHPPRSAYVRLGGYVHLPRLIDKARAVAAGKAGEFHYNCPLDQRFFAFTGIDHEAFMAEIKAGKGDVELLAYVREHAKPRRQPFEIAAWSAWFERLAPSDPDTRAFFTEVHRKNAAKRDDIVTWFDWLDLDDYVTYGGKA